MKSSNVPKDPKHFIEILKTDVENIFKIPELFIYQYMLDHK